MYRNVIVKGMKLFFVICLFFSLKVYSQSLRAVHHQIPPYIDFYSYNPSGVDMIMSTTKDTSTAIMYYYIKRDKEKILTDILVNDVNNNLLYMYKYGHNQLGQIIKIERISDTNFDKKVEEVEYTYTMKYDTSGMLTHMRVLKHFTVARDFEFIWENGNIIQVINTDGELNYSLLMDFDETENPLKKIQWEYFATTGNLEFYATIFCANNLTKAVLVPAAMDTIDLNIKPVYEEGRYVSNSMERTYFEYE